MVKGGRRTPVLLAGGAPAAGWEKRGAPTSHFRPPRGRLPPSEAPVTGREVVPRWAFLRLQKGHTNVRVSSHKFVNKLESVRCYLQPEKSENGQKKHQ